MSARTAAKSWLAVLLSCASFTAAPAARAADPPAAAARPEPCEAARAAWRDDPVRARAIEIAKCEMAANRPERAAEALAPIDRAPPDDLPEQTEAHRLFVSARARVAAVYAETDERDATLFVDGRSVGITPLADPIFVSPGRHVVAAKVEGRARVERAVDASAGGTTGFVLRTVPLRGSVIGFDQPGDQRDVTPRESSKSAPILIAGGAGAAVALAAAIALNLAANAEADAARSAQQSIRSAGGSTTSCAGAAALAASCSSLRDALSRRDAFGDVSVGAYVVAGLAAAATIAYAAWPERRAARRADLARASIHAAPLADAHTGGVQLTGVFR